MGDRNVRNRVRRRRDTDEAMTRRFLSSLRPANLGAKAKQEREARLAQIAEEERLTREFLQNEGWNLDNFDRPPEFDDDDDDFGNDGFGDHPDLIDNLQGNNEPLDLDEDDDEINDDSLKGLWLYFRRRISNFGLLIIFVSIVIYIYGQRWANRNGYGAAFFMFSVFLFICFNLGRRRPGEWSAYSVFNPNFQPIMGVRGANHPDQEIIPF